MKKHKNCKYGNCKHWKAGTLECGYRTKGQEEKLLKKLHAKAWKVQSARIRKAEGGWCFTCGTHKPWEDMHAGHFIHGKNLDFVPENIHCQCPKCNTYLHGNGVEYALRMVKQFGPERVEEIRALKHTAPRFLTEDQYKKIITEEKNDGV